MKRAEFKVQIDELDFEPTRAETFTVSAPTMDEIWVLAEYEADARCHRYGKVREYTLTLINEETV